MTVGIIYWSGTGNTEQMAGVLEEALKAEGVSVEVHPVSDVTVDQALQFDKLALGCPAMGDEQLEEVEFEPFYEDLKAAIGGDKPVVLFGSYSWNEGQWMEDWTDDARSAGLTLLDDGVACYEAPDDEEKKEALVDLAKLLAK